MALLLSYGMVHITFVLIMYVASYWWRKKYSGKSHPTPSAPKHKRFFNSFGKKARKEDHAFTFSNSIAYWTPYFNQSGAKKKRHLPSHHCCIHLFIFFSLFLSIYQPLQIFPDNFFNFYLLLIWTCFKKIIILFINNKIVTFVSCQ